MAATATTSVSAAEDATHLGRKEPQRGRGGCRREGPRSQEPRVPVSTKPLTTGHASTRSRCSSGPCLPGWTREPCKPPAPTASLLALTVASAVLAGYRASGEPLHLSGPSLPGLGREDVTGLKARLLGKNSQEDREARGVPPDDRLPRAMAIADPEQGAHVGVKRFGGRLSVHRGPEGTNRVCHCWHSGQEASKHMHTPPPTQHCSRCLRQHFCRA